MKTMKTLILLWKKLNSFNMNVYGKSHHVKQLTFIFLLMMMFTVGCQPTNDTPSVVKGPKVFLLNEENNSIEGISLELREILDQSQVREVVDYVLFLLHQGVSSSNFKPTIEDPDIIQYFSVDGKNVTINFNYSYYNLPFDEEIYLRSSVVKSLTSFNSIESIEFFVSGVPLKLNSNSSVGRQYSGDVLVTYDEATSRSDVQSIIMYFPNEDFSKLIGTYTNVAVTPNKKLEEIVVEKLLDSSYKIMPSDVKVLNIYTHEGICFVDFSSDLQTSLLPSGVSERIAIYALVNSLTELTNITSVQILVEGEKATTFQGTLSLNRIFTKNYSLIETDFGGD